MTVLPAGAEAASDTSVAAPAATIAPAGPATDEAETALPIAAPVPVMPATMAAFLRLEQAVKQSSDIQQRLTIKQRWLRTLGNVLSIELEFP